MKKYKWGEHTVKVYLESWNGGKGIRTVYLNDRGEKVIKLNGYVFKLDDFMGKYDFF